MARTYAESVQRPRMQMLESIREIAAYLGCTPGTAHKWIRREVNPLPATWDATRCRWDVSRSAVDAWVKSNRIPATDAARERKHRSADVVK